MASDRRALRNPVHRHSKRINRPKRHRDRKNDYFRKRKHKTKEEN